MPTTGKTKHTEQDYKDELKRLAGIIKDYKKVVSVMGKGIGKVAIEADFIGFWNDTEIAGSLAIKEYLKEG